MEKGFSGKDVLVFVSADWCGHCTKFKQTELSTLKSNLSDSIKFVNYNLGPNERDLPNSVPQHIKERVRGFPSFIFVSADDWVNGAKDKVFGEDGSSSGYNRTGSDIAKWANTLSKSTSTKSVHRIPSSNMKDNGGKYGYLPRRIDSNDNY